MTHRAGMPPRGPGAPPPAFGALVCGGGRVAWWSPASALTASAQDPGPVLAAAATVDRVVVWSADRDLRGLVARGRVPARILDLAEAHRLLVGGWRADPDRIWARVHGLERGEIPQMAPDDLFAALTAPQPAEDLTTAAGYLRPDAVDGDWLTSPGRLLGWARAAYECGLATWAALGELGPRAQACAISESSAAVLCLELERDGLPVDRDQLESLIAASAGERPRDLAHARQLRAERDARVLAHAPAFGEVDLRNPAQVKAMLLGLGIEVSSTRKWHLEPYREAHPVVPALLTWRAQERIATTYGYAWLDAHVGADDRLRGGWTACDGAAGRMTAQNGLHNLPAVLRPAVRAAPGHRLVRADLGQIEPRVLACVSQDAAFAAATEAADLYAPVAQRLGVERPVAKVAVLAAMYGQRSGTAGAALSGLQRAYPVAMGFLDRAYEHGSAGKDLRTYGGRRIRTAGSADAGGRGRYARNALIQGAAAELFKAWASTVRVAVRDLDAEIVLCLHDELLVHTPQQHADECARRVGEALTEAARRWSGDAPVRFVTDAAIIERWSEAK